MRLFLAAIAVAGIGLATPTAVAHAAPDDEPVDDDGALATNLVEVPAGCAVPTPADVAFIGFVTAKDFEKARYRVVQLRAGSLGGASVDGLIDVLYFDDVKFLDVGEQYLVGARFDDTFGSMFSTVRPAEPLFGGNDVIGLNDSDVECPVLEDPVRTVRPDGSSVDSGVISPLLDDKARVFGALALPALVAFGVLAGLVLFRQAGRFTLKGILELGRAAVTPAPDHASIRVREHHQDDVDISTE